MVLLSSLTTDQVQDLLSLSVHFTTMTIRLEEMEIEPPTPPDIIKTTQSTQCLGVLRATKKLEPLLLLLLSFHAR